MHHNDISSYRKLIHEGTNINQETSTKRIPQLSSHLQREHEARNGSKGTDHPRCADCTNSGVGRLGGARSARSRGGRAERRKHVRQVNGLLWCEHIPGGRAGGPTEKSVLAGIRDDGRGATYVAVALCVKVTPAAAQSCSAPARAFARSSPLQVLLMQALVDVTKAELLHRQVLSVAEQPPRSAVVMQASGAKGQVSSRKAGESTHSRHSWETGAWRGSWPRRRRRGQGVRRKCA
jgi:hypothetical protein